MFFVKTMFEALKAVNRYPQNDEPEDHTLVVMDPEGHLVFRP